MEADFAVWQWPDVVQCLAQVVLGSAWQIGNCTDNAGDAGQPGDTQDSEKISTRQFDVTVIKLSLKRGEGEQRSKEVTEQRNDEVRCLTIAVGESWDDGSVVNMTMTEAVERYL
jgi:hypothetical protein